MSPPLCAEGRHNNLRFYLLEVVSRYRDPQLQADKKYTDICLILEKMCITHPLNMLKRVNIAESLCDQKVTGSEAKFTFASEGQFRLIHLTILRRLSVQPV